MAHKSSVKNSLSGTKEKSLKSVASMVDGRRSYMRSFKKLNARPVLGILAGGVGIFALYKVSRILYSQYPQIGTFFRNNLDNIERRLIEFRDNFRGQDESIDIEARH